MLSRVILNPVFRKSIPWLIAVWTIIILFLTLAPSDSIPDIEIFTYDKLGHMVVFGGWTFLLGLMAITTPGKTGYNLWIIVISGIMFGAFIEFMQYITPFNRSASWYDIIANTIGCLIAYAALRWIQKDLSSSVFK